MNDNDWLRKHLRGKVQRRAVDGGDEGMMRRLVYKTLRGVRKVLKRGPTDPDPGTGTPPQRP